MGAIYMHNVTYNDTGTYRCTIQRTLFHSQYDEHVTVEKEVELSVVAVGKKGCTCGGSVHLYLTGAGGSSTDTSCWLSLASFKRGLLHEFYMIQFILFMSTLSMLMFVKNSLS